MTIQRYAQVFISATSKDLGSLRARVKKALEARSAGDGVVIVGIEQTDFSLDYRTVVGMLRERIEPCDALIHIAGPYYGAEPADQPDDRPRRSFTQLEYEIAAKLEKPIYRIVLDDGFPTDPHPPEAPELQERQADHRRRLMLDQDHRTASSLEEVDKIVRSLKIDVQKLAKELRTVDEGLNNLGMGIVFLLAAVFAVLLAIGYVAGKQSESRRLQEQMRLAQDAEQTRAAEERKRAEAYRQESWKADQIRRDMAEKILQELLADKTKPVQQIRDEALKLLTASTGLPLTEIERLIDSKVGVRTPEQAAEDALARGDYDTTLRVAESQREANRRLAMAEGVAALAKFRESPSLALNERALKAFRIAMNQSDRDSEHGWKPWTDAAIAAASVLSDIARYSEAEPLLRDSLRIRESKYGSESEEASLVASSLALLLSATDRAREAEALYRRALAIGEQSLGPDDPDVAARLSNLAELLHQTNRLAEAEPLYRRALAIDEASLEIESPSVAIHLSNFGELLRSTGRTGEAEPLLRLALAISERSLAPGHPDVAIRLNNLAELLHQTNRLGEAGPLYRRALAIDEASLGPDHPGVASSLNNLAELLRATDRMREAEPLYRRALAIDERSPGRDHPRVATDLNNLALLLRATDRTREAEPLYRRALAIDEASLGPGHPTVASVLNNLAFLLRGTDRMNAADLLHRRSVNILARFEQATGHMHPWYDAFLENYRFYMTESKLSEEEIQSRLQDAADTAGGLPPISPEVERLLGPAASVKDVLDALDRRYREEGKPPIFFLKPSEPIAPHLDEWLQATPEALLARAARLSPPEAFVLCRRICEIPADRSVSPMVRLRARLNRAVARGAMGQLDQAREEFAALLPEIDKVAAADGRMRGGARFQLAVCYWFDGNLEEARKAAEASLAIFDAAPKDAPIEPDLRRAAAELLESIKAGAVPPPRPAIDANAAIKEAEDRLRAEDELAKLGLDKPATPLLDAILGPSFPVLDVLEELDRENRELGRPEVWFLPLDEPISPRLDELLGPVKK